MIEPEPYTLMADIHPSPEENVLDIPKQEVVLK
jgi:hypothetical protein